MHDLEHVAVVGASLAGLRACEALRREGFAGTVTLIGSESHQPYDRPPLSKKVLAGEWEPDRISLRKPESFDELQLDLRLGMRAVAFDAGTSQPVARRWHGAAAGRRDPRRRRDVPAAARSARSARSLPAANARRLARAAGGVRRAPRIAARRDRRRLHRARGRRHRSPAWPRCHRAGGRAGAIDASARGRDGNRRRRRSCRPRRRGPLCRERGRHRGHGSRERGAARRPARSCRPRSSSSASG